MKNIKRTMAVAALCVLTLLATACGNKAKETVALGTYNPTTSTFTKISSAATYSMTQDNYDLTLKGTIPHSEGILGIAAGNIVAIRFIAPSGVTPGEGATIKTTNVNAESGWNEYDQAAFEEDKSLVWVTSVSKSHEVKIKIKWNTDATEVIYTLKVATDATLAGAV